MSIHELPPQVANQIAAGEVVERPAAVVKELMENAFDAGAKKVQVEIENGGSRLILVRDDGCGIPKNELALALKRHATSKISSIDDLDNLLSMGFRGEALASIAAVSRLTLVSKPKTQEFAWSVSVEGIGQEAVIKPASHPNGSSIEVRDLFFNTPARRRFLRTDKTEFQQINEMFKRLALSRRDAALSLKNNRSIVYDFPIADSDEIYNKRLKSIMGNSFLEGLLKFSEESQGMSFKGYINPSEENSPLQYFFLNRRIVKDRTIVHAINTAFDQEFGRKGNVSYVCFLEMSPSQFDINVHPQKYEVRFEHSHVVHDFIASVLVNTLRRAQQVLPESFEETCNPDLDHGYVTPVKFNAKKVADFNLELKQKEEKDINVLPVFRPQIDDSKEEDIDTNNKDFYSNEKSQTYLELFTKSQKTLEERSAQTSFASLVDQEKNLDGISPKIPDDSINEKPLNIKKESLNTYEQPAPKVTSEIFSEQNNSVNTDIKISLPWSVNLENSAGPFSLSALPGNEMAVISDGHRLWLLKIKELARACFFYEIFEKDSSNDYWKSSELPEKILIKKPVKNIEMLVSQMASSGFCVDIVNDDLSFGAVPNLFRGLPLEKIIDKFLSRLPLDSSECDVKNAVVNVVFEEKLPLYFSKDMVIRMTEFIPGIAFISEKMKKAAWELKISDFLRDNTDE